MISLTTLPVEILHRVFYYADPQASSELRLTCRFLADIGRPRMFEEVWVSPTRESYERLDHFVKEPGFLRHVVRICLDIRKWDPSTLSEPGEDDEVLDSIRRRHDEDGDVLSERGWSMIRSLIDSFLPARLLRVLGSLRKSPKFRGIVIRFHHEARGDHSYITDENQDYVSRLPALAQLMGLLASSPRLPRELAIQDLQNVNSIDQDDVDSIIKVLGALQTLRLNIANEHNQDNGELDLQNVEPHQFFPELPSYWLKPTMLNLRHLTLYSTLYFGFYPKCDLRGIHFPQLRTLSLGNYTFIDNSQLNWILSHGSTLTELYLDDCPILFEVAIYEREKTYLDPNVLVLDDRLEGKHCASYGARWCDYFRAFSEGLPVLRHFRVGHSEHWWDDDTTPFECETTIPIQLTEESYMVFCDGYGPSPYMKRMIYDNDAGYPLLPSEEDEKALDELLEKIGQTDRRISDL